MNDPFHSNEEKLARLIREAGDPSVSPDPSYAESLRSTILDHLGPEETVTAVTKDAGVKNQNSTPALTTERNQKMKRIAKFAIAASLFIAIGIFVAWTVIDRGSTNLAFAEVAKALGNIRTATYDCTMEIKNPMDGKMNSTTMKCFFLAPSCERIEMSISMDSSKEKGNSIMIMDYQAMKGLVLAPEQKLATEMDLSKIKRPAGTSNMFEMVRQLVREESSGSGKKVESLGKKKIDGRVLVGFRAHNNMGNQTFWADPQTARLVRIDIDMPNAGGHGVMSNFRYDTELAPSLFSLEPPAGYTVNNIKVKMPVEEDLVNFLRFVAEHNADTFPVAIGLSSKEYLQAIQAASISKTQEHLKKPETQKLLKELQVKYGKDRDGFMKAWMKTQMPFNQKLTQKIMLKYQPGMTFYSMLNSQNDSHYVGNGVKLDTPDRPIFWYKPTGADKYQVIYADLSVKEMTPEEVKALPDVSTEKVL